MSPRPSSFKMGTLEVYDAKQQKWVPHVLDYEKWMRIVERNNEIMGHDSYYRTLSTDTEGREQRQQPHVNFVTPVSQGLERAKSELAYESQSGGAITEKQSTVKRKKKRENKTQHVDWNALRY